MVQGGNNRLEVAAAQRHHEGSGILQVRTDPHLGDGKADTGQVRIAQFAARQYACEGMAQLLADPQLTLASSLPRSLAGGLGTPLGASRLSHHMNSGTWVSLSLGRPAALRRPSSNAETRA